MRHGAPIRTSVSLALTDTPRKPLERGYLPGEEQLQYSASAVNCFATQQQRDTCTEWLRCWYELRRYGHILSKAGITDMITLHDLDARPTAPAKAATPVDDTFDQRSGTSASQHSRHLDWLFSAHAATDGAIEREFIVQALERVASAF